MIVDEDGQKPMAYGFRSDLLPPGQQEYIHPAQLSYPLAHVQAMPFAVGSADIVDDESDPIYESNTFDANLIPGKARNSP